MLPIPEFVRSPGTERLAENQPSWPGYLLFARERTLMARPFDAAKLQTTGDAVPIGNRSIPLFPHLACNHVPRFP